jgi:hypothetical protein
MDMCDGCGYPEVHGKAVARCGGNHFCHLSETRASGRKRPEGQGGCVCNHRRGVANPLMAIDEHGPNEAIVT